MNILDFFFPKSCLECSRNGKYMCEDCLTKMHIGRQDFKNNIYSIWNYEGVVRKAIIKLKYNFASDIANELSQAAFLNLKNINFKNSILIPIPLHKQREKWRGFNQSELLVKHLAKHSNSEYEQNLLTRKIASKQQVKLHKKERLRNISGIFAVNEDIRELREKELVVFDDVVTTGATIKEAISTLKKAGYKKVKGLTLCSN